MHTMTNNGGFSVHYSPRLDGAKVLKKAHKASGKYCSLKAYVRDLAGRDRELGEAARKWLAAK